MKRLLKDEALMLRTCDGDGKSYGGFQWPKIGPVTCSDWNDSPNCGNGLHGLLWGTGNGLLLDWSESALWLVVRIKKSQIIDLNGKVKVPSGIVEFCGDAQQAVTIIQQYAPVGSAIVGGTATAGDGGTATAGYRGTATAGDGGTATAGYSGTATAGYEGTATAGDRGTATAGDGGTATAGIRGTATAGDEGTATAGYEGTATAGYEGTATAGDGGTATAGIGGTATAGYEGCISILYWNGKAYKRAIFAVGKNGIKPNVAYRVDGQGNPIEVKQ